MPIAIFLIFPSLFGRGLRSAAGLLPDISPMIVLLIVAATTIFFLGSLVSTLVRVAGMPRLFNMLLREEHEYVLYGLHYYLYTRLNSVSNSEFFNTLFGDSSFIVNYLQLVGINLPNVVQTGSNFGTAQVHDTPFLCTVGSGTMVSSRLAMMNARFSNSSFKLVKLAIGDGNFLGNLIYFPAGARVGDNCLLATKVMLPIDGPMRKDTGLLGSPPFEIPRSARKDRNIAIVSDERLRRELLARKDKFNVASMAAYLAMQWSLGLFSLIFAYCGLVLYARFGFVALAVAGVVFAAFAIGYLILLEWWSLRFRKLQPQACTVLDPYYWHIERHWKMSDTILTFLFKGTPYKNLISRMLGTPTGRMVFDDGYLATERTLTAIGDYCTLNEFSILQNHSLEDGVFKSDTVRLGNGCTIGPNAFVHYGVELGDNTIVDTDAFLMKGEITPAGSVWQGNPARQI
jgi:non-ribosomal peptide synthetase-like protein